MESTEDEYSNYWETNMFLQPEEIDSYFDKSISEIYCDSSSIEGTQSSSSSLASRNIFSERNRRKKLNERLYALRSVVPNITKMDKASIIRDAIEYIKSLNDEERKIKEEISELESTSLSSSSNSCSALFDLDQEVTKFCSKPKRRKMEHSPIEILELRVSNMGEKIKVVSLTCTCSERTNTLPLVKLCQIFESLNLKIITANITVFSGKLFKTVFLEADDKEKDVLKSKIENAIAEVPDSPTSTLI
ncbi:hypothetical protein ACJIZ3_018942 [Penstemon smallii]|uniref:BHLH domain-containing protein n=1 Tax=Penstemon smallii TaxID=265156 RepID=A0ABD3T0N9_9LAMI